jgi:CheY-like chemotaxis protein
MVAPDLRGAVVMVVDDHRDTLEMFGYVVQTATGAKVIMAESAPRALEILRGGLVPSIVVTNIEMPDFDGFWLLAAARGVPVTRHVPMIAISGVPIRSHRQDWRAAGFARALVKPVDPFSLCETIADVLDEQAVGLTPTVPATRRLTTDDLVIGTSHPGWASEILDVPGRRGGGEIPGGVSRTASRCSRPGTRFRVSSISARSSPMVRSALVWTACGRCIARLARPRRPAASSDRTASSFAIALAS